MAKNMCIYSKWTSGNRLFYRLVDRSAESGYMFSQIGFNDKKVDKSIGEAEFLIMKKYFSPSKVLKVMNFQAF